MLGAVQRRLSRGKYIILCESRGHRALNGSVLLVRLTHIYILGVRLTHIYISSVRLTHIYECEAHSHLHSECEAHIYIPGVRLTHT